VRLVLDATTLKEKSMLVLTRHKDEKIVIGDNITVMVIELKPDRVRLGIEAPPEVTIHREEVYQAIKAEAAAKQQIIDRTNDTSTPRSNT
jgi:carbon storage regulator